jgi:HK97 family phage major capsid protein
MKYAKEQRQRMDKIASDMRAIVERSEKERRNMTADERISWDRMREDYEGTEATVRRLEATDAMSTDLRTVPKDRLLDEYPVDQEAERKKITDIHARAFSKYLRWGGPGEPSCRWNMEEREFMFKNAQATTPGTVGGYIIPQGFSGQLEEAKKWFGGIAGTVDRFQTGTGNPWPWPTVNDTANKGRIIGQNVQNVETDIVFGQVTFNAYIGSSDIVLVPTALMEDSYFNMDALVARLLGIRLGRLFNWKCTLGTGSAEPTGIVTGVVNSGNIVTFATGSTTSIAYTNLVDIEHAVDPEYRYNPNTHWMFADATLKVIKKLVDGNMRPLWQPGLYASFQEGAPVDQGAAKPTILDHNYVINQDMASPAASAYTILFGDMALFKVREVAGMVVPAGDNEPTGGITVLRLVERYADYLQIGFLCYQRFDSNLIDAGTHPIAVGQQSAT